jgi:transposase-like protein
MSGRVYPAELFEEQVRQFNMKKLHCPYCLSNNLTDRVDYVVLFYEFSCSICHETFDRKKALTKNQVRNKKINDILE